MKSKNVYTVLITTLVLFLTVSCTEPEETMSWKPGTGLHIIGATEVEIGDSESYYVDGFTIYEDYTWHVNGQPVTPTREGEFIDVTFPSAGEYIITVSNGSYEGELTVVAIPGD